MMHKRSRTLVIAGLVLMLAGALDPLEGWAVILVGSALPAAGAFFGKSRRYRCQVTAFVMIAIGVAALFGLSALGGVGGNTGRSIWWLAICASYPVGWVIGLVGAVALLREAASG
jgi:4-hydroxybenzoate polyprenyltransferase